MNNATNDITPKDQGQIAILGAGESGIGAAILAKKLGFDVFVSDLGEIKESYKLQLQEIDVAFESGSHDESKILASTLIVKSPGIPDTTTLVKNAVEKGIPVISEIEFASRYTNAKIIAITGSNGKTTTTMLTHHILKENGYQVGLAGNIGDSFAKQVATDLDANQNLDDKIYVLELSSFQLDGIVDFKPDVAVLLNITADHLDRYDYKLENYIQSKMSIARNQSVDNVFIHWEEDEHINEHLNLVKSVNVPYACGFQSEKFQLQGRHNELNANAALLAAMSVGVDEEDCLKAINTFEPVKHRLQLVKNIEGVEYINDSKATNVDAVYYAIEGIDKPIVWIAGGVDKGNDYSVLLPLTNKIKSLVCLGKDNAKLKNIFNGKIEAIHETDSMDSAIEMASSFTESGDVVLLSPACASFDLFNSYEHRGDEFIKVVEKLKAAS